MQRPIRQFIDNGDQGWEEVNKCRDQFVTEAAACQDLVSLLSQSPRSSNPDLIGASLVAFLCGNIDRS